MELKLGERELPEQPLRGAGARQPEHIIIIINLWPSSILPDSHIRPHTIGPIVVVCLPS